MIIEFPGRRPFYPAPARSNGETRAAVVGWPVVWILRKASIWITRGPNPGGGMDRIASRVYLFIYFIFLFFSPIFFFFPRAFGPSLGCFQLYSIVVGPQPYPGNRILIRTSTNAVQMTPLISAVVCMDFFLPFRTSLFGRGELTLLSFRDFDETPS